MPVNTDLTSLTGQTRLLVADIDPQNVVFEDEAYNVFLGLNNQSVRLAAAQALDTIAISEVLIQKRIVLLDLETNGPLEAQRLGALSAELRRQEYEGDGDMTGFFDYAELVYDEFSARQRSISVWLRKGL